MGNYIDDVFEEKIESDDVQLLRSRAIVCQKNMNSLRNNNEILSRLLGETRLYEPLMRLSVKRRDNKSSNRISQQYHIL